MIFLYAQILILLNKSWNNRLIDGDRKNVRHLGGSCRFSCHSLDTTWLRLQEMFDGDGKYEFRIAKTFYGQGRITSFGTPGLFLLWCIWAPVVIRYLFGHYKKKKSVSEQRPYFHIPDSGSWGTIALLAPSVNPGLSTVWKCLIIWIDKTRMWLFQFYRNMSLTQIFPI